ncbi:uncharacterized protein LOC125037864 [Penaeus chinensis]|uniref:uncharacterized protein LOC125037864 n=1 Tax=Penaeus chinensis TaxID=139456 RepID=UPI001FB7357F|nr:uncharacterized protein LOC125037864 [Penaeus chinensis]
MSCHPALTETAVKNALHYDKEELCHHCDKCEKLTRLHAASSLLRKKMKEDLVSRYSFLAWEWFIYNEEARKEFKVLLPGSLMSSSTLTVLMGYGTVSEWFKDATSRSCEIFEEQLKRGSFVVIGHGDCCTNMLFRYDAKENPVEVLFLDFQLCRQASLAVDLNYFLFSNFDRKDRKEKMGQYLSLYHSSFAKVLASASLTMPYTIEEITKEFKRKNIYQIICGSILIPLLVSETQELIDFDSASGGRAKNYVEELRQNAIRMRVRSIVLR